jgi:hypothetical protein
MSRPLHSILRLQLLRNGGEGHKAVADNVSATASDFKLRETHGRFI